MSWWPSSSEFAHVISIDSIEHRTLNPGIFKFKLSGLLPDSSHLVTVTAKIPNYTSESSGISNYSASVEFRTLPSRVLGVPSELVLERDPHEADACLLTWKPVCDMPNAFSNGIQVGGYSIYLDGVRVHQILNPYGKIFMVKHSKLSLLNINFKTIDIINSASTLQIVCKYICKNCTYLYIICRNATAQQN